MRQEACADFARRSRGPLPNRKIWRFSTETQEVSTGLLAAAIPAMPDNTAFPSLPYQIPRSDIKSIADSRRRINSISTVHDLPSGDSDLSRSTAVQMRQGATMRRLGEGASLHVRCRVIPKPCHVCSAFLKLPGAAFVGSQIS